LTPPGTTVAPRGELRPSLSEFFTVMTDFSATEKDMLYVLPNRSFAIATTRSELKPNSIRSSLCGAKTR
jgi:hypothetical protein